METNKCKCRVKSKRGEGRKYKSLFERGREKKRVNYYCKDFAGFLPKIYVPHPVFFCFNHPFMISSIIMDLAVTQTSCLHSRRFPSIVIDTTFTNRVNGSRLEAGIEGMDSTLFYLLELGVDDEAVCCSSFLTLCESIVRSHINLYRMRFEIVRLMMVCNGPK